jgi:hypothetical protein
MLIIEISSSRIDVNGNRYHAATVLNKETGKQLLLNIDGTSNLRGALLGLFGEWEEQKKHSHVFERELPIREFNRFSKLAVYAGCTGPEIAQMIHSELSPIVGIVD